MRRDALCLGWVLALIAGAGSATAQNCQNTSTGKTPLTELASGTYQGFPGGLYAPASNARPVAHQLAGLAQVSAVVPRSPSGAVDPANGRIGFLSIGMSNASQEFTRFAQLALADPQRAPHVVPINGAQGGVPAEDMTDPAAPYWTLILDRVQLAGLTPAQVQVLWLKQANRQPSDPFPQHAQNLKLQLGEILRNARALFPNAAVAYLNSRSYAGYATGPLNPEPWAYEQAFAVKWLIADQIAGAPELAFDPAQGAVQAPWLSWGVYAWADGLVPRADGLIWECADFAPDGTHPSNAGREKMAQLLLAFLKDDPLSAAWFRADPQPLPYGPPKSTSLGTLPRLGWSGVPRAGGDFHVTLSEGVPHQAALLFWSSRPANVPFLGGLRLVASPVVRLTVRIQDEDGAAAWPIDAAPLAGTTRFHQAWMRDPTHPDGTGIALSDGLMVRF